MCVGQLVNKVRSNECFCALRSVSEQLRLVITNDYACVSQLVNKIRSRECLLCVGQLVNKVRSRGCLCVRRSISE